MPTQPNETSEDFLPGPGDVDESEIPDVQDPDGDADTAEEDD